MAYIDYYMHGTIFHDHYIVSHILAIIKIL